MEIRDGHVYINGALVNDDKLNANYYYNRGDYGQIGQVVEVPAGHYFVLGDNSAASHDSRYWGFVPRKDLIGKITRIYWPLNRFGPVH